MLILNNTLVSSLPRGQTSMVKQSEAIIMLSKSVETDPTKKVLLHEIAPVPAGVYIVRAGTLSAKVAVK